ncbi:MAG: ABC transporter ATP-binding protein/permease, partial [Acidithiobacillus sp.]|nr:ABC transporter ATP-binding protein/permease [Acidithiobacillus sp.]
RLYQLLVEALPESAIISVGHRSSLLQHHQHCLRLQGNGAWVLEVVQQQGPAGDLTPAPA